MESSNIRRSKNNKSSSTKRQNGFFSGKLEILFQDIYEIGMKDIDEEKSFTIQFQSNKVEIGKRLLLSVSTETKNLVFMLYNEDEQMSPRNNNQSNNYLNANTPSSKSEFEQPIPAQSSNPSRPVQVLYFDLNVAQMFASCLENSGQKIKVSKRRETFNACLPYYEKSKTNGQVFEEKKEIQGFVTIVSTLNITVKDESSLYQPDQ